MNQVVKITGVFTQSGTSSKGDWTRWDVKTAGGSKFQTFDARLGKKAEAAEGQSVDITYHEEDRGKYTNNVIDSIEIEDEAVNAESVSSAQPQQDEFRRSKEEMRRTEAVKAAATLLASPKFDEEITIENLANYADAIVDLIANGTQVPY